MILDVITGAMTGIVKPVLDKFIPDATERLAAEQAILNAFLTADLAQLEVNKEEAKHSSLFVSGWRPAIGWVCGFSFAYSVVGWSLLNWTFAVATTFTGHTLPVLPTPDTSMTMELLIAMLGLGGMRTYEKMKGVTK